MRRCVRGFNVVELSDPRLSLLLALADDELSIGHRHSEWTGWAPVLEEDLAFSSIAQDEIGHATLLYGLAHDLGAPDPDALAFGRKPSEYRCASICEQPNGDWAYTLARHHVYDIADDIRLQALERSSYSQLGDVARVLRVEEVFHLRHAELWMKRLDSEPRLRDAMTTVLSQAGSLFEPIENEAQLVDSGVMPVASGELFEQFQKRVGGDMGSVPVDGGGRRGLRSEHFEEMYEDMTGLYRGHAGASW